MDELELGWRPIPIIPVFSYDQDWIVTLNPLEGSPSFTYPPGTSVYARIYADNKLETIKQPPLYEWPGTIVGDQVRFHTEAAATNLAVKNQYMRIMIIYPGTPVLDPFCWAKGKVVRDD